MFGKVKVGSAKSVGPVPPDTIGIDNTTMLSVLERENVKHGLLPLPSLRDTGRCRMLVIHTGGVRHPSSEETNRKTEIDLVAAHDAVAV